MSRYWKKVRAEGEEVRRMTEWASFLVRDKDGYPGCDLTILARKLYVFRAMEAVRRLADDAFEGMSADRLSLVLSRLERAASMTDHNRLKSTDYYLLARTKMAEEWKELLRGKPELLAKLQEAVDEDRTKRRRENPSMGEDGPEEGGGAAPETPQPGAPPQPPAADAEGEGAAPPAPPASAPGEGGASPVS
jgi:hypothetical protein